jgi:hypothetical protein
MKKLFFITILTLSAMFSNMLIAQIVSVTPDNAIQGDALEINVTAENVNFSQGSNVINLTQGSTTLQIDKFNVTSSTSLTIYYTFTVNNPTGYYDLTIETPGKTLTKTNVIYVNPDLKIATLDSILPKTASQGENVTITLHSSKTNFDKAGVANSVYLNNGSKQINAVTITPIDSVTLAAQFNFGYGHTVGLYSIFAHNTTDGLITIPNAFNLLKGTDSPSIITVNPDTVTQGQTLDIEVTAENVDFTQGSNIIYFKQGNTQLYPSNFTIVTSATTLKINYAFTANNPIGYYDLTIITPGTTVTKNNAVYVKPNLTTATLDSIVPKTARQGENVTITMYGTNTNFNKPGITNSVYMSSGSGKIYALATNPIDSRTIEATFSFGDVHPAGLYSITLNNPTDGTLTITNAFRLLPGINSPAIVTVNPDTVTQGQTLAIEVTAVNVDFTQGSSVVNFTQGSTVLHTYDCNATNATSLAINYTFTANNPTGYYDLTIYTQGKTITEANAIYVMPDLTIASLDSIKPNTASQGENVTITLHGTNTSFDKSGIFNSVYLNDGFQLINATATNIIDSVTLEAQFRFGYAHPAGLYSIFVSNSVDGTITIPNAFSLLNGPHPPVILTVNPETVTQGEKLNIEVTGENTDFTQASNLVYFSHENAVIDVPFFNYTVNSATSMTIHQPFTIDYPVGFYNLTIMNTGSGITLTKNNAVYVNPDLTIALIDSIAPKSGKQGDNITLTVYGTNTNFDNAGVTNFVYLKNGYEQINAKSVNPVNSKTLEAQFDFTYGQSIGLYTLHVNNGLDGTVTKADAFSLLPGSNAPAIFSVTPDTLETGQTLDIEVTGVNVDFTQGSNSVSLTQEGLVLYMNFCSANSPTTLSANFTLSNDLPAGNYNLSIWNSSIDVLLLADQTMIKEKAFYMKSKLTIGFNVIRDDKTYFYPNPVNDFVHLDRKYELVQLFDMKGRKILEAKHEDLLNVSDLQKGMYIIKLKKGNDFIVKKLIKQ